MASKHLKLFPNPFYNYATLKIDEQLHISGVELLNITGQLIRTLDYQVGNEIIIHRGNLNSGIYFLRVRADNTYVIKLVLE